MWKSSHTIKPDKVREGSTTLAYSGGRRGSVCFTVECLRSREMDGSEERRRGGGQLRGENPDLP